METRQSENEQALGTLTQWFWIGAVIAGLVLMNSWDGRGSQAATHRSYTVLYLLWSTLIWASAHLAVKKGRELIEGAVLGAFGPLGFIIEVLLPPSKDP